MILKNPAEIPFREMWRNFILLGLKSTFK